jgi:hypothetical protein
MKNIKQVRDFSKNGTTAQDVCERHLPGQLKKCLLHLAK